VFLAHRGFDELNLAVAYSDVDYALKLRASGLKILWTPEITLYHHESKTRGLDHQDPEKRARDAAERAVMEARWGAAMSADPSVNPVWHMATLPFVFYRHRPNPGFGLISRDAPPAILGCRKGVIVGHLAKTGLTWMDDRPRSPIPCLSEPDGGPRALSFFAH
jgi:hypothetical protein